MTFWCEAADLCIAVHIANTAEYYMHVKIRVINEIGIAIDAIFIEASIITWCQK